MEDEEIWSLAELVWSFCVAMLPLYCLSGLKMRRRPCYHCPKLPTEVLHQYAAILHMLGVLAVADIPCDGQDTMENRFASVSGGYDTYVRFRENKYLHHKKEKPESVLLKPLSIHSTLTVCAHSFFDHFIKDGEMNYLLYFVLALTSQAVLYKQRLLRKEKKENYKERKC